MKRVSLSLAGAASLSLPLSLGACQPQAPRESKPADAPASVAQTPAVIDLSACVGKALTLEEFVKTCQTASGFNFTYSEATQQALAASSLRLFGNAQIQSEQFEGFLGAQLGPNGFECKRIGPERLRVFLIQRRAG